MYQFKTEKKVEFVAYRMKPIEVKAYHTEELEIVDTPDGIRTAVPGDWIVEWPEGEYTIVPNIQFQKLYEPALPPLT